LDVKLPIERGTQERYDSLTPDPSKLYITEEHIYDGNKLLYEQEVEHLDDDIRHITNDEREYWNSLAFSGGGGGTSVIEWKPRAERVDWWYPNPIAEFLGNRAYFANGCYHEGYFYMGGGHSGDRHARLNLFSRYNIFEKRWEMLPDSLWNTYAYTSFYGNKEYIYVVSGHYTPDPRNGLKRYHIPTKQWERLANGPVANMNNNRGGFINDTLYVLTGTSLYSYDPVLNQWSGPLASPGFSTDYASVAIYQNELYVFGAVTAGHAAKYNPIMNTWTTLVNASTTSVQGWGCLIGSKIYVMGNATNYKVYDIPTNSWTNLTALPITIYQRVGLTDGNILYFIGADANYTATLIQDPLVSTSVWNRFALADALSSMDRCSFARYKDKVFIGGGEYTPGQLISFNLKTYEFVHEGNTYTELTGGWAELRHAAAFEYNEELYFVGNLSSSNVFRKYNINNRKWEQLPNLPFNVSGATYKLGSIVLNDEAYICQGQVPPYNNFAKYNFSLNQWILLSLIPWQASGGHTTLFIYKNKMYSQEGLNIWQYNEQEDTWIYDNGTVTGTRNTQTVSGTIAAAGLATSLTGIFNDDNPLAINSFAPGVNASSIEDNGKLYIVSMNASFYPIEYDINKRIGRRLPVFTLALQDSGVFIDNDWLYVISPVGYASKGYIYIFKYHLRRMLEPEMPIAIMNTEQTLYYASSHDDLFLTFKGEKIPTETFWKPPINGIIMTGWSESVEGVVRLFLS